MTCQVFSNEDGSVVGFSCTRGGEQKLKTCSSCGKAFARLLLCDEPLRGDKEGQTCSRACCEKCAKVVGPDKHLCPPHAKAQRERIEAASWMDEQLGTQRRPEADVVLGSTGWLAPIPKAPAPAWHDKLDKSEREFMERSRRAFASHDELRAAFLDEVDRGALVNMFEDWFGVPSYSEPTPVSGEIDSDPLAFLSADEPRAPARPAPWEMPSADEVIASVVGPATQVLASAPAPWEEDDGSGRSVDEALELADYARQAFAEPPPNAWTPEQRAAAERERAKAQPRDASRRRNATPQRDDSWRGHAAPPPAGDEATLDEKRAWVRGQTQTREHHCHWPGCRQQVPPAQWGCSAHWRTLPKWLRDKVWAAYKPGQEVNMTPSRLYIDVMHEVEAWIAEYKARDEGPPKIGWQGAVDRAREHDAKRPPRTEPELDLPAPPDARRRDDADDEDAAEAFEREMREARKDDESASRPPRSPRRGPDRW